MLYSGMAKPTEYFITRILADDPNEYSITYLKLELKKKMKTM